jgi:ribosomal protein S25
MYAKLSEYFETHTRPVSSKQLADRYLASLSNVRTTLAEMESRNIVKRKKINRKDFWYNAN